MSSTITSTFPVPPHTQALQSATFVAPPLDGSLTFPEFFDWQLKHSENHPLFVFYDEGKVTTIHWGDAVRAIYSGVHHLRRTFGWKENSTDRAPVVGIVASSDTLTYFTALMSVFRAGYVAFPISPRNSSAAIAHLINSAKIQYLLVGKEQSSVDLADSSIEIWKKTYATNDAWVPSLVPIPSFGELSALIDVHASVPVFEKKGLDELALYLHSSGSTAFPKLVPHTHRHLLEICAYPYYGGIDWTGKILSIHSVPLFHMIGSVQCFTATACGLILSIYAPKNPAQLPSPDTVIENAKATYCDYLICVPSIFEAWHKTPEHVDWLATCSGVMVGGGPLDKAVGNEMVSKGVKLFNVYGLTELGPIMPFLEEKCDKEWEYIRFCVGAPTAKMVPYGDNTYELVLIANERCHPRVINSKFEGIDAYATNDLFIEHPDKPGSWKIFGRADDQIMHSSGEKTNPGPLEAILNQDPHVQSSVMFGRGKFQAGVIVDPKPTFRFDPSDERALEGFRNTLWPSVQKMNAFAPQHSRLFKEMILIAKPDKPFTYTAKNTPRRGAIINEYAEEIEALYEAVEATSQTNIELPESWDINSVTEFVRRVVGNVLVHKVKDDDDLFQHGCDSLQATWIRNALSRALRESVKADTRGNTDNFVYSYPTISKLSAFLFSNVSGNNLGNSCALDKEQEMEGMMAKYSVNFPAHRSRGVTTPTRKRVLLTGSTGGVGAFVLYSLVADDEVERIYCINRPSHPGSSSMLDRQRQSFDDKGLPLDVLNSQKIILLGAQLAEETWSLGKAVYDEMLESVTHIIHNAWPVDFNLSLSSFETNIQGLRNLIDFSLASPFDTPPVIVYTSSIGVFQNLPVPTPSQLEKPIPAAVSASNGYNESKWVSEQILAAASASTPLKTVTVRVGQVSGGPNGFWDTKQWLPAIAQSAKRLGCFPDMENAVSFVPAHVSAHALIDFMDAPDTALVHLTHPNSTPWTILATALSSELGVPLVPYNEWLTRLEAAAATPVNEIAALRLLGFFKFVKEHIEANPTSPEAFGLPHLDTTRAVSISKSLATAKQLTGEDAKAWVAYWKAVGFVQ